MIPVTSYLIQNESKREILRHLCTENTIWTVQDLVKQTGLSRRTVTTIMDDLYTRGFVDRRFRKRFEYWVSNKEMAEHLKKLF